MLPLSSVMKAKLMLPLKRSLLFTADASTPKTKPVMTTSFADIGVRRYSWQNGVKHMVTKNELPFTNLWFNDTKVFASNLGLKTSNTTNPIADDDTASWIVNRLSDYKVQYPSLPDPQKVLNVEFKQTASTGKMATSVPDYGMVSVEQASGMTIASAKVLGPTRDSIASFWGKQTKGFTRNDCYAKLRVPELDAHPRNVDKWLNAKGATDLPV